MVAPSRIAVDNIGDNRHNQLLQLSFFLTAAAALQTLHLTDLSEKTGFLELCRKPDVCREVGFSAQGSLVASRAVVPHCHLWLGDAAPVARRHCLTIASRRGRRTTSDA
jgi:hypothetical protein